MRILCILSLLMLVACEGEKELPIANPNIQPTKGYDAYVFACTIDGEKEELCKCQAKFLSEKLSDKKLYILAEAGAAASKGDVAKIDEVMAKHPDVIAAMKNIAIDTEICLVAINTDLETLSE